MNVNFINPFIVSFENAIEMMLGVATERDAPYLKGDVLTDGDVTGVIGFAEKNVTGSVSLSFPEASALYVYHKLTGENIFQVTRDVQDSIGELTNIVAGGAKTALASDGITFHIGIPSVIVGKHKISHSGNTPVVAVPFRVENRKLIMEISMKVTA